MEKFTASNGVSVLLDEHTTDRGRAVWVGGGILSPNDSQALREFFLHERDQELGRWRWPENPDYVVYRDDRPGGFRVLQESTGDTWTYLWEMIKDDPQFNGPWNAARAYFAAHPEPKPWHEAKPGEVWVLKLEDGTECAATREYGVDFKLSYGNLMGPRDERIQEGRRIWPEASND